ALQERNALMYHWSVRGDGRGAVQEREHVGVGQAERDMEIPRSPQVLDWVVRKWAGRLFSSVGGERVASDRFEQSLHIAEVAIDRRRLHPRGRAHRSRGYRVASAGGEQFGGGSHDPGSSVRFLILRSHQRKQYCVSTFTNR